MDEMEREDMRHDMEIDAMYTKYKVNVIVEFEYVTTARNVDDAEDEAYDAIKAALSGSYLDYDFDKFNTEEMEE